MQNVSDHRGPVLKIDQRRKPHTVVTDESPSSLGILHCRVCKGDPQILT